VFVLKVSFSQLTIPYLTRVGTAVAIWWTYCFYFAKTR